MYVHQKEEAEEIVTDVFVKSWMNRSNMQHIQRPDTYLFVAVKNQSLNYLKKYSTIHIVPVEDSGEVNLIDIANPHVQLEKKELHFYLDQSIDALPQQCRIIFRLIKEDGLKYKEVAQILEISPRTVQTQLFRAIDKLRQALKTLPENERHQGIKGKIMSILILSFYLVNYLTVFQVSFINL